MTIPTQTRFFVKKRSGGRPFPALPKDLFEGLGISSYSFSSMLGFGEEKERKDILTSAVRREMKAFVVAEDCTGLELEIFRDFVLYALSHLSSTLGPRDYK